MVTNSFGNRNFMHPMGRLIMHSKCLVFFPPFKFWVGVGWGRIFFFHFLNNLIFFGERRVCSIVQTSLERSSHIFPFLRAGPFTLAHCEINLNL